MVDDLMKCKIFLSYWTGDILRCMLPEAFIPAVPYINRVNIRI
jgi:hypothetical protein